MFHYVFLDPATIDEAVQSGEMGLGRLVELLVDFRRDVFLVAETDSWRVGDELGEKVRAIPNEFQHERKQIADLLTWLGRHSPLIVLEGDSDPNVSLLEFVRSKASEVDLDMILSPGGIEAPDGTTWINVGLTSCHKTALSQRRASLARGLDFDQGVANFAKVANDCFEKLVRHAKKVRIYDYALGRYYNNDQPLNLKRMVRFLRDFAPRLRLFEILTESDAKVSLIRDIGDLQNEVDFKIIPIFKSRRRGDSDLPHPRYLGADNRYLDIDLGIDLCDFDDRCRKIRIKYSFSSPD